jgi:uncharacterized secreted protein with C-terminal beta-propeller domain
MTLRKDKAIFLFVLILVSTVLVTAVFSVGSGDDLQKFHSYTELQAFLASHTQTPSTYNMGRFGPTAGPMVLTPTTAQHYSTTNIQVAGVDEADSVKSDGIYIYTSSANHVSIVKAYPTSEAQLLSTLTVNGSVQGLYIDGTRLVVLWENYTYTPCQLCPLTGVATGAMMPIYVGAALKTTASVYDVSDRASPVLKQTVSTEGYYLGSRMIGDYLYTISSHYVWNYRGEVVLPQVSVDGRNSTIPAEEVYYSPQQDFSYVYTMVVAMNVQDNSANPIIQTYLIGASGTIYVSPENLYLTVPSYRYDSNVENVRTIIHRIHLSGTAIQYEATGAIPGYLQSQYSLDEYNGFLRIATTIPPQFIVRTAIPYPITTPTKAPSVAIVGPMTNETNNVYILNLRMQHVSALEGLAPGEKIYATRFLGDRAYLDTFKQVDPLFVLDLSNPYNPHVLGQLQMPGYTNYLYPLDATHLIGIGKDTSNSGWDGFAWYQGVKVALFDVSDVSNPKLISNYTIGDRGTDSTALHDPHAFFYDPTHNLLVLPIHLALINTTQYGGNPPSYAYGQFVWQGVYIFKVTLDQGIVYQGRISHINNTTTTSYWDSPFFINRALSIEGVLYTVSDNMIQMHAINTLSHIGTINLPTT